MPETQPLTGITIAFSSQNHEMLWYFSFLLFVFYIRNCLASLFSDEKTDHSSLMALKVGSFLLLLVLIIVSTLLVYFIKKKV